MRCQPATFVAVARDRHHALRLGRRLGACHQRRDVNAEVVNTDCWGIRHTTGRCCADPLNPNTRWVIGKGALMQHGAPWLFAPRSSRQAGTPRVPGCPLSAIAACRSHGIGCRDNGALQKLLLACHITCSCDPAYSVPCICCATPCRQDRYALRWRWLNSSPRSLLASRQALVLTFTQSPLPER